MNAGIDYRRQNRTSKVGPHTEGVVLQIVSSVTPNLPHVHVLSSKQLFEPMLGQRRRW